MATATNLLEIFWKLVRYFKAIYISTNNTIQHHPRNTKSTESWL